MNSELTDIYSVLRREFGDVLEYFGLQNNRELAAFLHYNAHNEKFIGTNEDYYYNANFLNLDTGRQSRIFKDGFLYFFPTKNDRISNGNKMTVFSISRGTKCIRVNENGLFVEKNDLKGNIITKFFDRAALDEISEEGYTAGNIDYIEEYIDTMGINPDKIIHTEKKDGYVVFSIVENGEIVKQEKMPIDDSRTLYSMYYELMKSYSYYGDNIQQNSENRIYK